MKRLARRLHPEALQQRDRMRHQTLAARLVDGSVARSTHDLQPGSRAEDRGGQPGRRPPPEQVDHRSLASARSRHRFGSEHKSVEHREHHSREPRGVNKRQRYPFDDDRDVVRVGEEPVRRTGHPRGIGDDDNAGVPLLAERRDTPPAQSLRSEHDSQHRPAQSRQERAIGGLQQTTRQQAGVQHDHRRIVTRAELDATATAAPGQIALGHNQFRDAFDRHRGDQQGIPGHEQLSASATAPVPRRIRPHRHQHAGRAARRRFWRVARRCAALTPTRGCRSAQRAPRQLECVVVQAEGSDRLEDLGPPGGHPRADVSTSAASASR